MAGAEHLSASSCTDSEFRAQLVKAALMYVDSSFVDHTRAAGCYNRMQTEQRCMSTGLGNDGFDCSGLIVRAMSDVIGKEDCDWASRIRHVPQLCVEDARMTSEQLRSQPIGALVVYSQFQTAKDGSSHIVIPAAHVGIYVGGNQIVHARRDGQDIVAVDRVTRFWGSKRLRVALMPEIVLVAALESAH